jgi:hypothetical protein
MYAIGSWAELLANPWNSSVWDGSSLTVSSTHPSGGRSKYVYSFVWRVEDHLIQDISKMMHTLLKDVEAVFLGFSNVCASAGKDGCKLVTLLRIGATGEEIKRLIEEAHDVSNTLRFCYAPLPYPQCDPQVALKVWLTNPAKSIVEPRQLKRGYTFVASRNPTRVHRHAIHSPGLYHLIRPGVLELYR